ncbi:MAG: cupin domain-containing protein [Planctomycetota bacterium]
MNDFAPKHVRALFASSCFLFVSPSMTQQPNAQPAQNLPELEQKLNESGRNWLPFLDTRSLTCGLYTLKAGSDDNQSPHALDEIYYVVRGVAKLSIGKGANVARHSARAGTILHVPAGVPHHFVDIEEDLTTLVFFSKARATRGGMAAGPKPTEQTPYDESSERGNTRIFYWFGDHSAGQVWIDFGRPQWNDRFGSFIEKPHPMRWRLGENSWTTLDTNIPLEIGSVKLDVGQYYLVLGHDEANGLHLIALDPAAVRKQRLDAYEASKTTGGIVIPLERGTADRPAGTLDIELKVDRSQAHRATLDIRFGSHRLHADVVMLP